MMSGLDIGMMSYLAPTQRYSLIDCMHANDCMHAIEF